MGGLEGIAKRVGVLFGTNEGQWKTFVTDKGDLSIEDEWKTFHGFYITGSRHYVDLYNKHMH